VVAAATTAVGTGSTAFTVTSTVMLAAPNAVVGPAPAASAEREAA
jgi:hypothetical protein